MFNNLILENIAAFQQLQWQQHERLNLIIGENDCGKTHLLKLLYGIARSLEDYQKRGNNDPSLSWQEVLADKLRWIFQPPALELGKLVHKGKSQLSVNAHINDDINLSFSFGEKTTRKILKFTPHFIAITTPINALFLPPKEILTVMDAIEATRSQLEIIGFDDTYLDLIKALRLPVSRGKLHQHLKTAVELLDEQMGKGQIEVEQNEFMFKRGHEKYTMSQTAEGIKKIGILNRLIKNRMLKPGSILFVDEPEVNLHPKAIVALVDIFFLLAQQAGIQIYLATHNYFVLRRFEWLARKHNEPIGLCSLFRSPKNGVLAEFYNLRDGMPSNPIIDVSIELYEQNVILDFET